ncbi:LANO_0H08174g1_1 [Lachancea nothofagi CBS 11611]|uniref:Aminopeptidase n=1 Tax=Lachancea nothofagi CBS 11611 TaxID=1266666 RepID=A0A1G4KLQ5_9SACH|nr:LANO_0H08174g1_1 [Lachancea nothofagi CBS 11611]
MLSLSNPAIPTRYDITLSIDPRKANFRGVSLIDLTVNKNLAHCDEFSEFSELSLHGRDLIVLSATMGDQKLDVSYDRSFDLINLKAKSPIKMLGTHMEMDRLILEFVGKMHSIKTFQDVTRGLFKTNFMDSETGSSDNFIVATHAQPGFAKMIFPCVDEINHKAHFQLTIVTLERFHVISNTAVTTLVELEAATPETTDLQKQVSFEPTPLMTPSLFGFVLGDMKSIESRVSLPQGEIAVRFFAAQQVELAAFGLDTVREFLPVLQEVFKQEYPLSKLDFALLPFLSDMAMENFGLVTVQQGHLLLEPSILADDAIRDQVQQLVIHELVHQWMGNYISFDSWEHLWFNEAFATWCACEVLSITTGKDHWASNIYLQQMNTCLKQDALPECQSVVQSAKKGDIFQTSDAVDPHSYTKGISLIRSLQCSIGKEKFKATLQKLICDKSFHERAIKPSEIWNFFGQQLGSANIANFMYSWTQTPSFPVLHVISENGSNILKQHRFGIEANHDYEDIPYHIPLFTRLPDGSMDEKHVLMTDRSLKLTYPVVLFNADVQGYYRVSYESAECYEKLCEAAIGGVLSKLDLYGIFRDLEVFVGNQTSQKQEHLNGLLLLLRSISSRVNLREHPEYFHGLSLGLTILQQVELSVLRFGSVQRDFGFLSTIILPLFKQIEWPDEYQGCHYDEYQLLTMSQVLSAGKTLPEVQSLCKAYYKKILQGPNGSVPYSIAGSVFTVVSYQISSLKEWKKQFELIKSSQGIASHVSGCSALDIQDSALEALGFCRPLELAQKVLNFVSTNFESTGSEKALFGLSYNAKESCGSKQIRDVVWDWFNLHYDQWAKKAIKANTEENQQIANTLIAVSIIVFEMWQDMPEKIDTFAITKQSKFKNDLRVNDIWASLKSSQASKMKIYQGLLGF